MSLLIVKRLTPNGSSFFEGTKLIEVAINLYSISRIERSLFDEETLIFLVEGGEPIMTPTPFDDLIMAIKGSNHTVISFLNEQS